MDADELTEIWAGDDASTSIGTWVEAAPFRAHLQWLMTIAELSYEELAQLAGVSRRAAEVLLYGRRGRSVRRVCPEVARRLYRLGPPDVVGLDRRLVPAAATLSRLIDLLLDDGRVEQLSARAGVGAVEVWAVLAGSITACTASMAMKIGVLHEDLVTRQFEERFAILPARRELEVFELEAEAA